MTAAPALTPPIAETEALAAAAIDPGRIGQRLLAKGAITPADIDKALAFQADYGGRLGQILLRLGAVGEAPLIEALQDQLGWPVFDKAALPTDAGVYADAIGASDAPAHWWADREVALWRDPDTDAVICLARDPFASDLRETLDLAFPTGVTFALARSQVLEAALETVRKLEAPSLEATGDRSLKELAEEAPVIDFVNTMFAQAAEDGASDIHIEPRGERFVVRFRVDGVLSDRMEQPRARYDAIASRIKLISGIDIAERRLPQDGRQAARLGGKDIDMRVSTLPGMGGESLVLRLLPKEREQLTLKALGMSARDMARFGQVARSPHGVILVTGPTGSGKSTTLYATLQEINDGHRKIVTVEDPVEYNVPGVFQTQVNADIGMTFARALRSILRQDPDVIMVGEMRDGETAQIGIQAALTGHMVFSTLHTNDAISAVVRLVDMGVEPFLVAASTRAMAAQRLVRKLCQHCSVKGANPKAYKKTYAELLLDGSDAKANWREPRGCEHCGGTGFKGRMALFEFAEMTPELAQAVHDEASRADLLALAKSQGLRTLREDGWLKARAGLTSWREVLRVTGDAEPDPDAVSS
ncbi:MAG: GspE/PulE family protein [Maricaulaceae bacterium]